MPSRLKGPTREPARRLELLGRRRPDDDWLLRADRPRQFDQEDRRAEYLPGLGVFAVHQLRIG